MNWAPRIQRDAGALRATAEGLDAAAERHHQVATDLGRASSDLAAAWTSPAATRMVADLRDVRASHRPTAPALAAAAGQLRSLANQADTAAARVGVLEERVANAERALARARWSGSGIEGIVDADRAQQALWAARRDLSRELDTWNATVRQSASALGANVEAMPRLGGRSWSALNGLGAAGAALSGRSMARAGFNARGGRFKGRGINVRNPALWVGYRTASRATKALAGSAPVARAGLTGAFAATARTWDYRARGHKGWTGRRGFIDRPVTTASGWIGRTSQQVRGSAGAMASRVAGTVPRVPGLAGVARTTAGQMARRVPVVGTVFSGAELVQGVRSGDGLQIASGAVGIAAGVAVGAALVVGGPVIVATATALTVGAAAMSVGGAVSRWWKGRGD
ncbi:MAG: hypothetical protein JJT89_01975 [Nitriliruptoraceae bacterium]|nr:hypothetical protein [Nitriliruptoraceae bacterium]